MYKVLATTQPSYLHKLITVQPPRSTRSSSLVTHSLSSTIILVINNWSFLSMCFTLSLGPSSCFTSSTSSQSLQLLISSCHIIAMLILQFHHLQFPHSFSLLKTYFFTNPSQHRLSPSFQDWLHGFFIILHSFWAISVFVFSLVLLYCLFHCGRSSWLCASF